jgi:hypothetical protein
MTDEEIQNKHPTPVATSAMLSGPEIKMHSTIENMFRVVTIAREYGSGGAAIGRRVAQSLGWRLLDNDLIEAVARWANVDVRTARRYDECVDSWWHRLNRAGLWSAAIMAGASPADVQFFDADTLQSHKK